MLLLSTEQVACKGAIQLPVSYLQHQANNSYSLQYTYSLQTNKTYLQMITNLNQFPKGKEDNQS